MDSAAYVKGQNNMLYLPMIVRDSDADKTLKMIGRNNKT